MFTSPKLKEYHPSRALVAFQVFLLVLIVIGLGLIATQKLWVPKLVAYILNNEGVTFEAPLVVPGEGTTPPQSTTTSTVPPAGTTTKPAIPPVVPPAGTIPETLDSGVLGVVTIGPTCPVVRYPDDGTCADRPYETTLVIASAVPGKGGGVLVRTDARGHYSHDLAPGTYTVQSAGEQVMPTLRPVTFTIVAHKRLVLDLQFDSGIR